MLLNLYLYVLFDIFNYFLTYVALSSRYWWASIFWLTADGGSGDETTERNGKFRGDTATNGAQGQGSNFMPVKKRLTTGSLARFVFVCDMSLECSTY